MPARLPKDEVPLVRLAAECSQAAFTSLMDRFRRHLRLVVGRYADGRDDRDDLEADVVEKLLRDGKRPLRAWAPRAPFVAYLTTIASRHCIQWAERRNRLPAARRHALPPWDAPQGEDWLARAPANPSTSDPSSIVEEAVVQRVLTAALGELSAADRLALALRFEQGLDGPDMGRVLGISPNAARQRVFKALRRLERLLVARHPDLFASGAQRE